MQKRKKTPQTDALKRFYLKLFLDMDKTMQNHKVFLGNYIGKELDSD